MNLLKRASKKTGQPASMAAAPTPTTTQHTIPELARLQDTKMIVEILQFVESNRDKISALTELNGGWEAWLQIELALHFQQTKHYYVEREQRVFINKDQKIDLWCCPPGDVAVPFDSYYGYTGVELKCESLWQDTITAKNDHFVGRMREDLVKVEGGIDPRALGGRDCTVYAVGVTTDPEDVRRLRFAAPPMAGHPEIHYWVSSPAGGPRARQPLYVMWWQAWFPVVS